MSSSEISNLKPMCTSYLTLIMDPSAYFRPTFKFNFILQADELCKILSQNKDTLSSLNLIHCRFSSTDFENICISLYHRGTCRHGLQYLSIMSSRVFESKQPSTYSSLIHLLSSGRCTFNTMSDYILYKKCQTILNGFSIGPCRQ